METVNLGAQPILGATLVAMMLLAGCADSTGATATVSPTPVVDTETPVEAEDVAPAAVVDEVDQVPIETTTSVEPSEERIPLQFDAPTATSTPIPTERVEPATPEVEQAFELDLTNPDIVDAEELSSLNPQERETLRSMIEVSQRALMDQPSEIQELVRGELDGLFIPLEHFDTLRRHDNCVGPGNFYGQMALAESNKDGEISFVCSVSSTTGMYSLEEWRELQNSGYDINSGRGSVCGRFGAAIEVAFPVVTYSENLGDGPGYLIQFGVCALSTPEDLTTQGFGSPFRVDIDG